MLSYVSESAASEKPHRGAPRFVSFGEDEAAESRGASSNTPNTSSGGLADALRLSLRKKTLNGQFGITLPTIQS